MPFIVNLDHSIGSSIAYERHLWDLEKETKNQDTPEGDEEELESKTSLNTIRTTSLNKDSASTSKVANYIKQKSAPAGEILANI